MQFPLTLLTETNLMVVYTLYVILDTIQKPWCNLHVITSLVFTESMQQWPDYFWLPPTQSVMQRIYVKMVIKGVVLKADWTLDSGLNSGTPIDFSVFLLAHILTTKISTLLCTCICLDLAYCEKLAFTSLEDTSIVKWLIRRYHVNLAKKYSNKAATSQTISTKMSQLTKPKCLHGGERDFNSQSRNECCS